MIIGIASDHKGFLLKQSLTNYLKEKGYNIIDYGTNSLDSVDYPPYAFKVGEAIQNKNIALGILICGTGIGMSIACNKVKTVRCAKVSNLNEAFLAKSHNKANVIAISAEIENSYEIIDKFLETPFSNDERHNRRIEMIDNYDN
ncbi:MAG: RpiB/LacA/LacB family sugar-phosphate isomerase [Bacilli bacterium]